MIGNGNGCATTGGEVSIFGGDLKSLVLLLKLAKMTTQQVIFNTRWAIS